MSFKGVMQLLNSRIGLHGETISQKALTRAVKTRMARRDMTDTAQYQDLLTNDALEMEWLIDQVVVHETWFFRDVEPFRCLRKYLFDLGRQEQKVPVRMLSLPCSSGEEPYSIAMTAAGLPGLTGLKIDAVDVSGAALEKARKGRYGPNAFRESEMGPYWRFFRQTKSHWHVSEEIIRMVQFHRGNILDYKTLDHNAPYQVIFCRNLLIYLDENARRRAVDHIDALLAEDGLLFLGYAESRQQLFPEYIGVRHHRAYASLKPGRHSLKAVTQNPRVPPKTKHIETKRPRATEDKTPFPPGSALDKAPKPSVIKDENDPMEKARQLADAGHMDQAAQICKDILARDPGRAGAHFLLGVLALAGDDEAEAEACFTRALYLDPEHIASLNYMVLLMEKRGRNHKADLFRGRLIRLQHQRPLGDERKAGAS